MAATIVAYSATVFQSYSLFIPDRTSLIIRSVARLRAHFQPQEPSMNDSRRNPPPQRWCCAYRSARCSSPTRCSSTSCSRCPAPRSSSNRSACPASSATRRSRRSSSAASCSILGVRTRVVALALRAGPARRHVGAFRKRLALHAPKGGWEYPAFWTVDADRPGAARRRRASRLRKRRHRRQTLQSPREECELARRIGHDQA